MNPIAIYPDNDLDDYEPPRFADFHATLVGILKALEVWKEDKQSALAIIKSVRKYASVKNLLAVARDLSLYAHDGTSELELAQYLLSSIRFHLFEDSLAYAEFIVDNTPTKACDIIHKALKKEEEDERIDKILELCEHKLPLFVELAHKELRQIAIRGNIRAMYVLGRSYFFGTLRMNRIVNRPINGGKKRRIKVISTACWNLLMCLSMEKVSAVAREKHLK